MSTPEGTKLANMVRLKLGEMNELCKGLGEETASRAPAGRWSPKEIISHLCGTEGGGLLAAVRLFLEQDMPRLDIEAEKTHFTGKRARMTFSELRQEFEKQYTQMADLVSGLSEEQLGRKAHIPLFKETPMGEYPTLANFVGALADYHMEFHIKHMREILQALGVK
jgi:hypothetical protein